MAGEGILRIEDALVTLVGTVKMLLLYIIPLLRDGGEMCVTAFGIETAWTE
jgi:hypothetical protein